MTDSIVFAPLLPWPAIWVLAAACLLLVAYATWARLRGWWLRGLGLAALLLAIAGPQVQTEDRAPLSDIVIAVVDDSSSQQIGDRPAQTKAALDALRAEVAARPNTELRVVHVGDGEGDTGTLAMSALSDALAQEPLARVAGAVLISDGQVHDIDHAPRMPAPLHLLMTGHPQDWDRRLMITNAPAFGIIGEPLDLTLKVENQGAVPADQKGPVTLSIAIDGGTPQQFHVPTGKELTLPVTLDHGGQNVIQFSVATAPGELTDRNNTAVVQINGVRDRLRVLLVSGEPHPGERTWRNLLKSDASVDLVHFTILRPPEKQDGVPVSELSLIAFPTRELFLEKIDQFDLIIFDRYKRRGILPALYLENIRNYVEQGGAVLFAAGPDFASADSLFRSPLADIVPATPTSRVIDEGFKPKITDLGQRHPVTAGLEAFAPPGGWGRWFRQIDVEARDGAQTVMSGVDKRPLLVLDRIGKGRVALLASDQAWLWDRGYEGGGPQLELLRRLAHWMMKEPELEEEALTAAAQGSRVTVTRHTLKDTAGDVTVTGPDGKTTALALKQVSPGKFQGTFDAPQIGLYRLAEGDMKSVIAVGPAAPREFEETVASADKLSPAIAPTNGGALHLSDGMPGLRDVRPGRPASGRGWIGITPRGAYVTRDITVAPILPAWAFLVIAAFFIIAAWLLEGRRSAKKAA